MKDSVELRSTLDKGEGVFSMQPFECGDVVMIGVIQDVLAENHSHASQVGENEFVFHAGLITKVNHSCSPNCGIKVNKSGGHDFIAMTDINVGQEITFDYAMRNYDIDFFPDECMCGSHKCRKQVSGWKDLSIEKKKEYKRFSAPYLFELDVRNCLEAV